MRVEKITVGRSRVTYVVRLDSSRHYTDPALMQLILRDFPRLEMHACKNAVGPTFGDVMNNTSLAHLLEHLVIDLQVSAHAAVGDDRDPLFLGNTQWVDEGAGLARVQVNYYDDLVCLRAFKKAVDYINGLL